MKDRNSSDDTVSLNETYPSSTPADPDASLGPPQEPNHGSASGSTITAATSLHIRNLCLTSPAQHPLRQDMSRSKPIWRIAIMPDLPDDEAQIYLPQGDLTQSDERHMGAPIILYEKTTRTLESRGRRFPIFRYYLSGEPNTLLERMAVAQLIFQGLWVLPIQQVIEEEKGNTGEGLPFNDGSFSYGGQPYRVEVTGTYPQYPSGANLREMYGRASSKTAAFKPQVAPRLECLTCQDTRDIYVRTVDDPVPHQADHTWICWFPPGWPGSKFSNEPTARLSPINDSPEFMATAMRDAVSSKAKKLRQNPPAEQVCLVVMAQGFPMPSDKKWVDSVLEEAALFDMVLSVHVDGHIGFIENESFSYESVGQLLKCPLCREEKDHRHKPVFAMIRHQFNEAGTWAIHATTNEQAHMRDKHATWGTIWHEAKM